MLVSRPRRLGIRRWGHPLTGLWSGGPTASAPIRPRFIPGSPQSCPRIPGDPSTGLRRSIHRVVPRCGWKRGGSWTQGDGGHRPFGTPALHDEPTDVPPVTGMSTERDRRMSASDHRDEWRSAERPLPDDEREWWDRHAGDAVPDPIGTAPGGPGVPGARGDGGADHPGTARNAPQRRSGGRGPCGLHGIGPGARGDRPERVLAGHGGAGRAVEKRCDRWTTRLGGSPAEVSAGRGA